MQKEYDMSTMAVQELRRDYQRLLKTTEAQKRKLESATEPKAQDKYVILTYMCACMSLCIHACPYMYMWYMYSRRQKKLSIPLL